MTKLGAHVCPGERLGFGDFLKAKPRLVIAVGEGGSLVEAKSLSGGHTTTIYRDISVYLEAPGDINSLPAGITLEMAAKYWYLEHDNGGLRARWQKNPADYYTITNEQGGSDPASLRNLVTYERAVMKLANADGFKVCVLNQAGGSPGDFEMWKALLVPFILEAWAAGNIYGRHTYGFPDLVGADGKVLFGNPYRPIKEIEYLNSLGAHGGMAITECGLDGGFGYPGDQRFYFQLTNYEREIARYDDIIGLAMWNLGYWQPNNASWQSAIPEFVAYMKANPIPAYVPPETGSVPTTPQVIKNVVDPDITAVHPQGPEAKSGVVKGLSITSWELNKNRSDFRIHDGDIWFKFHYDNNAGHGVPYGGMGVLVEKWQENKLVPHYYQHSYAGMLPGSGGPGPDASWSDHWKPHDVGIFALTPYLTFDNGATNKRDNPDSIVDGHKMGEPIWVNIGSKLEPGGIVDAPAGAPKPVEVTPPPPPTDGESGVSGGGDETALPGYQPGVEDEAANVEKYIWQQGLEHRLLTLNPSAALQKVIFAHAFVPVSREFWAEYDGLKYACQMAENLQIGEKRVYYVLDGEWDDVHYLSNAPKRPEPLDFGNGADPGTTGGSQPAAVDEQDKSEPVETADPVIDEPAELDGFQFERWPTTQKFITQAFGKRPEYYSQFGYPGHEGIDLAAPMGSPYYAAAPGTVLKVADKRRDGKPSAYGWHVIIDHGHGLSTLYAHAAAEIAVKVGDQVNAGQIIAFSGNTGNSSGPHLHMTVKKQGYQLAGWPAGLMDPWPLLEPLFGSLKPPAGDLIEGYLWGPSLDIRSNNLAITKLKLNMREQPESESPLLFKIKQDATVRLLSSEKVGSGYYHAEASVLDAERPSEKIIEVLKPTGKVYDLKDYIGGDGRIYEVKNADGGQERFQTQWDGSTFYQTKNANWEQFFFDNDFIYRDIDTSPGAGRYYRLTDNDLKKGSRWARRKMALDQIFLAKTKVQFYNDRSGEKSAENSGDVSNSLQLVAHYDEYTFRTGITVKDVLELHWLNGGEKYFYAKDYGLVGWERIHFDPNTPAWSAIAEIHGPGKRPDNSRRKVTGV